MLKVEEIEGQNAVNVISDDRNGENAALDDAINDAAPHLHLDFMATEVVDGLLTWRVERSEYGSLLEAIDMLEGVNDDDLLAAEELVEKLHEEVV